MDDRISNKKLSGKMVSPQEAASIIKDGMTVAMGGFTPSGYPKVIPKELLNRRQAGEQLTINLITAANVGPEIDDDLGDAGIINRRLPLQGSTMLGNLINQGKVNYVEIPLNKMPRFIQREIFGNIDVAVVEAIALTKDGYIVPSTSIGLSPHFVQKAKDVIVELNSAQPSELVGMHDIYIPALPPNKKPVPLVRTNQRIGEPFIKIDPNKIKYIVKSDILDQATTFSQIQPVTKKISDNLFNFLELEVKYRWGGVLAPIQTGLGNMANQLTGEFKNSKFTDIEFFCGILQEANIELIAQGKVKAASAIGFTPSAKAIRLIKKNQDVFERVMVLRPTDVSSNGEIIERLGVVALNSAIEIDIYGNANTSHAMGTKVLGGIGGGGVFTQNSQLSIMLLPSETKGGVVSTIVPMVTHNDINEHDIDVVITENGVADLRGKTPVERAKAIIGNCASSVYKDQLYSYLRKSIKNAGGHQPQLLREAFSWHLRLQETGTMRERY